MTDSFRTLRRDAPSMALAVVGVLLAVAVGFGVFVGSIRVLLPAIYPHVGDADPTLVATVVAFGPTAAYGVVVAVPVYRFVVKRG